MSTQDNKLRGIQARQQAYIVSTWKVGRGYQVDCRTCKTSHTFYNMEDSISFLYTHINHDTWITTLWGEKKKPDIVKDWQAEVAAIARKGIFLRFEEGNLLRVVRICEYLVSEKGNPEITWLAKTILASYEAKIEIQETEN